MANINKDYLVIVDVKKSSISLGNGSMTFNILDKNTSNIFVNLVINTSTNELIHRFTNIENAEDYTVVMNIVKPNNEYLTLEGELRDKEKAVFEFNLPAEAKDAIGTYNCELLTKCNINGQEEITTSNKVSYKVKESVLNNLDDVITEAPTYPIVIELFDRLSDIERYEEDRRQAEIVRELSETARVEAESIREQEHDLAMQDIEDKIIEVESRATEIETNIANKFREQDNTIATKFTQHEEAVEEKLDTQDEVINTFINDSIARMDAHEQETSNEIAQFRQEVTTKNTEQDNKLSAIEVINNIQNERLDKVEKKNKEQDYTLACLFAETDRAEINFDGNSEQLLNSKDGLAIVNSFEGQTMVNLNKEADKELILNKADINVTGQQVDITDGVDGGLVDVYAQGKTMVNVCNQQDSVPLTMSYTAETGNHVTLQGEYDGKAKPHVYGNTLVNLIGNGESYKWPQQITATRDGDYVTIDTTLEGYENGNIVVGFDSSMLKPSTTYTIIFKELGFNSKNVIIRDHTANSSFINVKLTDKNYHVFTTLSTQSTEYFIYYAYLTIGEKVRIANNIVILEGDYTNKPIPNYFEGLQSSFEDNLVPANLFDMDFVNSTLRYTVDNEGYITYDRNNVGGYNYLDLYTNKKDMIKPNTKYTVFINIKEFTLDSYFYFNGAGALIDNGVLDVKIDKPGTYVYTLTTASDISSKQYGYFFNTQKATTQGKITFKIAIVEGDYSSWNIADFENAGKYKVEYKVTGKNKFDINEYNDSTDGWSNGAYRNKMLQLKPNTTYTVSSTRLLEIPNSYTIVNILDSTKKIFLAGICQVNTDLSLNHFFPVTTFSTDSTGIVYLSVSCEATDDWFTNFVGNIQIEEGSTATTYEPYKEYTKTLYLNSPLLEGDSIEVQGNNIVHVHRYAKVTEKSVIGIHEGNSSDPFVPLFKLSEDKYEASGYNVSNKLINAGRMSASLTGYNQFYITDDNHLWVSYNGTQSQFLDFIRDCDIVCKLKTPTYELISTNDNLYIDSYANGHLDFDSAVPVEKVEFKCFSTNLTYLKPNTQYLAQFEADNDGVLLTSYIGSQGREDTLLNFSKGLVRFNMTNSEGSSTYFALRGIGANISNIVVTEAANEDFGYFKGMKSVGEVEGNKIEVKSSADGQDKSNIQTIQLSEPLRSLPNGVCDKIVKIDGQWYIERNCAEVTLDGTEIGVTAQGTKMDWYSWEERDNTISFALPRPLLDEKISGSNERNNTLCDLFVETTQTVDSEWHMTHSADTVAWWAINILKTKLSSLDVDGFKQWLSKNPTTVVYQLATPTYEKINYNPLEVYTDHAYISNNSTIPCVMDVKNHGFNALLKPSTTYTISSSKGVQSFQTGDTLDDCLRLYGTGTMKDVTILEGAITDTDLIPSHFEGIESAFEQTYDESVNKYKVEIKTTGKNLWQYGDEITDGVAHYKTTNPIFKKGHTYTISCQEYYNRYNSYPVITFYDLDLKEVITRSLKATVTVTFTDDIFRAYLYSNGYNYNDSIGKPMTLKGLMIEEGTTATAYEPYKESNISFYLDEPLRGIGDVRDDVKVQDGKVIVTRRCGEVVFNGGENEDWHDNSWLSWSKSPNYSPLLLSNLKGSIDWQGNLCISFSDFRITDCRKWLSENPITVVYQLKTPTIEEIELDKEKLFLESYKDGHISFSSNIPVMNTWVEYSVAVAMLDNMLATASITDEQDFLIVDLATQLAIMQLTI